jgi:hypothetical protein
MTRPRSFDVVCDCCDLDVPEREAIAVRDADRLIGGWRCRPCEEHRDSRLKRAQDHEAAVRARWTDTLDELEETQGLVEDYRAKMKAACRARDAVLEQFARLERHHRPFEDGCICGKRNCETLAIVDADWINDRIAAMYRLNQTG